MDGRGMIFLTLKVSPHVCSCPVIERERIESERRQSERDAWRHMCFSHHQQPAIPPLLEEKGRAGILYLSCCIFFSQCLISLGLLVEGVSNGEREQSARKVFRANARRHMLCRDDDNRHRHCPQAQTPSIKLDDTPGFVRTC